MPDGQNVARIGPGGIGGSIWQDLTATLQANTTYTLQVDVCQSQVAGEQLNSFSIELDAVGLGTSLAVGFSPPGPIPALGAFLTDTLVYNSGPNPLGVGLPLQVRLNNGGSFGGMALFDNVRLDATPIPIPGAAWLLGAGLGLIGFRKKFLV